MREDTTLTDGDEGKNLVNARGDEIGRVIKVQDGTAHVDPNPGLGERLIDKLGWGDRDDEDIYRLDGSHIDTVTDDEVRLRK
ncbi:PRC-barrel domain containing protein [Halorubrum sp. DTA46]|uniref:PRC-barrel domain containing protein n=1 Tax=Halorubrum sp. DTA46 TaxID=3402162 RepID=UPI003AAFE72F